MSDEIRQRMWKAMAESPYVMVSLTGVSGHAEPMTAILDEKAGGKFWFYMNRNNRLAPGGRAMAQFVSPGHDLFCCISGTLAEERDPAVVDRYWSSTVEAWFAGGRNDPDLLMMRFDLDDAEIWTRDSSFKGLFKLMSGRPIQQGELGEHTRIRLEADG